MGTKESESMEIQFKRTSELTEIEQAQVDAMSAVCFKAEAGSSDDPAVDYEWAGSDWCIIGTIHHQVVSHIGLLKREVTVDGAPIWVGGVGSVMTDPGFQKQGLAAALLKEANTVMRDHLQVGYGMLFCSPSMVHYYQKCGWQMIESHVEGVSRGSKIIFPFPVMSICISGQPWPKGEVDICGLPW